MVAIDFVDSRRWRGCYISTDLESIQLVVGDRPRGKCEHRLARGGIVRHDRWGYSRPHIPTSSRICFQQPIERRRFGGSLREWIVAIEIDDDRVFVLHERACNPRDGLRHHRNNLRS